MALIAFTQYLPTTRRKRHAGLPLHVTMAEPPIPRSRMDNLNVDIDLLGKDTLSCVRPTDKLEGRVHVTAKYPLHFTRAEVYLQG